MAEIHCSLHPDWVAAGVPSRLKLEIRHDQPNTLHNLILRVQGAGDLKILGSPRLNIDKIEVGCLAGLDLLIQARQAGPALLKLDHITARLAGKSIDLPAAVLALEVRSPEVLPENTLTLTCKTSTLELAVRRKLSLRVTNNARFSLSNICLNFLGEDFNPEPGQFALGDLEALTSQDVQFFVTPRNSGDLYLRVSLGMLGGGRSFELFFDLPFSVAQDRRVQEIHNHGPVSNQYDVIQIGRNPHARLGDVDLRSDNPTRSGQVGQLRNGSVFCPNCKQQVPAGLICDQCGGALDEQTQAGGKEGEKE